MHTTNTARYAQRELDILSKSAIDPNNRPIIEPFQKEIIALCEAFGKSGQSGGSAPFTASALSKAIKKLCLQEPICPIMGIDEEWVDVSRYGDGTNASDDILYQNSRCGGLFKNKSGKCWYLDAVIWKGDTQGESGNEWDTFNGLALSPSGEVFRSRQYIKTFPFQPKTFYIDVTREALPEDWTQEPFIEGREWYSTEEYERTGIKNWHKDKYRYIIKDMAQMDRVFKYYDVFVG